jgi:hypothetical protein
MNVIGDRMSSWCAMLCEKKWSRGHTQHLNQLSHSRFSCMHIPSPTTEHREMSYGGHQQQVVKDSRRTRTKGCIGSTSAFEFEVYISSKMPPHMDIRAVNHTSLRHFFKFCMAVLPYQVNFACADLFTCWVQLTWQTFSQN